MLSVKPESGGGLLLLRHVTPLSRRRVVYFYSGAYNSRDADVSCFFVEATRTGLARSEADD